MTQNSPVRQNPALYMNGLNVTWDSITSVKIHDGQCRDLANVVDMGIGANFDPLNGEAVEAPLTVRLGDSGAAGLDVGTIAANTWYGLWIVGDSAYFKPVSAVLSLASNEAPALPQGYDSYRLRCYVRTNASSQLDLFYMLMSGTNVVQRWDTVKTVLTNGNQTSYDTIDLNAGVPPVDRAIVRFEAIFTASTAGDSFNLRPTGSSSVNGVQGSSPVASQALKSQVECVAGLVTTAKIDFKNQNSDLLTLNVIGSSYVV